MGAIFHLPLVQSQNLMQDLRRLSDAKAALRLALKLSPFNSHYLAELGEIYALEKNWPQAMKAFNEAEDNAKLADNLRFLREQTGVHVHADLIVGLPGEDVASFAAGFLMRNSSSTASSRIEFRYTRIFVRTLFENFGASSLT